MRRLFALLLVLLPLPVAALEVRVHPGDFVYAYEVDPARGLYTVVLQNVAVVQRRESPSPWTRSRSRRSLAGSPSRP